MYILPNCQPPRRHCHSQDWAGFIRRTHRTMDLSNTINKLRFGVHPGKAYATPSLRVTGLLGTEILIALFSKRRQHRACSIQHGLDPRSQRERAARRGGSPHYCSNSASGPVFLRHHERSLRAVCIDGSRTEKALRVNSRGECGEDQAGLSSRSVEILFAYSLAAGGRISVTNVRSQDCFLVLLQRPLKFLRWLRTKKTAEITHGGRTMKDTRL